MTSNALAAVAAITAIITALRRSLALSSPDDESTTALTHWKKIEASKLRLAFGQRPILSKLCVDQDARG